MPTRKSDDRGERQALQRRAEESTIQKHTAELADQTDALRQTTESLPESQERFHSAFHSAAIGMALVSPEGRCLQVNDSLCEIVGYSESELLATTLQAITHPDDLETDLGYV